MAIFTTKPITIKCTTSSTIAVSITLFSIIHSMKNATREGALIMIAIRDPFAKSSFLDLFFVIHHSANYSLDAYKV